MAKDWAEITWEVCNNGSFITQFPPNIVILIRQHERIDQKCISKNVYNVKSNTYQ